MKRARLWLKQQPDWVQAHVDVLRRERSTPVPNITVVDLDGELCFEWWRGEEKYTLYAHPGDVIHVTKDGKVEDGTQVELLRWLGALPSSLPDKGEP